jgi:uncharacterized membrane protein
MNIVSLISGLPPELATFLLAMLPSVELGASIPLALEVFHFSIPKAYLISVAGTLLPTICCLWLLGPLSGYLVDRYDWARRFFGWLFARTRNTFVGKYERWGDIALVAFVSIPIPLPLSGLWTGAIAAFIFGIPKRRASILLGIGGLIAGAVAVAATVGISTIIHWVV